ncbi:M14 family zinc carboxypeptidase [uncultured Nocardioides sp.]|uniref:M14 family zinc carboxypeptidase n=1 Tax=uncultured Nocardioides sp. TaxID=198441 RepID=UPI0026242C46|nr:M14 family zinc carboxypeptidase [uncultured Nocardioides sp.]
MSRLGPLAGGSLALLLTGTLVTGATSATAAPEDGVRAPDSRSAAPSAPARSVRTSPEATARELAATSDVPAPPSSYPSQPQLKVFPANPADASIARGAFPYDEIAPRLQRVMRSTDAVSTQVVGQSTQGRDIYLVTLTAPETAEQTAQQAQWREAIKEDAAAAASDTALQAGYKLPIWFNGNIHGNEWEGADMTLDYIDEVVDAYESGDRAALNLLRGNRMYFTVTNNPDGRVNGTRQTALGLDPNRDFITNTTPETTIIRDLADDIQPLFFSDLHGYTGNLQVEPTGPPHGENYDYDLFIPHAYESALEIEDAVVEADIEGNPLTSAGGILIPYRDIPSGWDDWPPIFTAQYMAFQGAVTSTVELPLGRGTTPVQYTPAQRTAINKEVGAVVMDTTVDYFAEKGDELLDNQIETFRRGEAGEPLEPILDPTTVPGPTQWQSEWDADGGEAYAADLPRAYVIGTGGTQRSETDAAALVDFLVAHDIEVSRATADFDVDGTTYPAGSYVVDMHQPMRGLANALLDEGSDISDRVESMYDVSAWAPGLIWGATTRPVGSTTDADLPVAVEAVDGAALTGSVPAAGDYLGLKLLGGAELRALNDVLAADVPVTWLPSGTAVLGDDPASYAAAEAAAAEHRVTFTTVDPAVLESEGAKGLDDLRIGYTGTADDRLALGQMGFDDLTLLTAAGVTDGSIDLGDLDVLYIGAPLTFTADQTAGADAVRAFLSEGRGVVGRGSAAATFATTYGLLTATSVVGNSEGTGIVDIETPEGSLLEPVAQAYGLIVPATWFTNLGVNTDVEARYGAGNPLVSGHWDTTDPRGLPALGPDAAAGKAAVISGTTRRGANAMVFGTTPTFRTYTRGAYSQLGHGLLWAAGSVEGVQPPTDPEPPVEPTTPELGMTLERNPIRVGQKPRALVELDLGDADVEQVTLQVRKAGTVIATRTVSRDGSFVVGLPKQPAGKHRIRAVVLPTETTTRANSPLRILRVTRN